MRTRRQFLSQIGLGPTFLPGLIPLLHVGRAQAAPPRRLCIIQTTNGVLAPTFWPRSGGETDFVLNETTMPLEPHRKDITILSGYGFACMKDDPDFPNYGGHASLPYMLTGAQAAVGRTDGNKAPVGNAISLDQHVAEIIGKTTPIKSLELGAIALDSKDDQRSMSFRGPAIGSNPARPAENRSEINPAKVFTRLLGAGGDGTVDESALARLRLEKKSILDSVKADLESLRRRVGTEDRKAIEGHATFVRQIEAELDAAKGAISCGNLGTPPAGFAGNRTDGPRWDKVIKAQLDNIVVAFRCDITRVATLMMYGPHNNLASFPFLGPEFQGPAQHQDTGSAPRDILSHHEIAHNVGTDIDRRRKNRVDRWFVEQFAYLISQLKGITDPAGGGSILDNTLILFANNMADGGAHSYNNLPWITAGRAGGTWKTGRYVKVGTGMQPHNGLLIAIANALDAPAPLKDGKPYFGDPRYGGETPGLRV